MGFTQVDENTVMDDEGNTYFTPFIGAPDSVSQPLPGAGAANPGSDSNALPDLEALKTVQEPQKLPSASEPSTAPTPTEGNRDFVAKTQAAVTAPPTGKAGRDQAMTSDVAQFSAAGGQAKTDEDMMRMMGGHAGHEAETAKAKQDATDLMTQGTIAKNKAMADIIMDTATKYDEHVKSIMDDANSRWTDWKKRNDQATARMVDPNHAFTNMSTGSRAGWMLAFIGAGMQGGNNVEGVAQALNKLVEHDIASQKFNIENQRGGLDSEKGALVEADRMGKDSIADWYAAKNLRLTAIGKQLDAKIAEIGLPAARQANLLSARDMIEREVLKGQQHVADHFFSDGQKKAGYAHDIYMERMKSTLRMKEDEFKAKLKKGEERDTLPTGTQLGLQMVDKTTGKGVALGQIPLKVKGEKAVEAGQIMSAANDAVSGLRKARDDLKNMSTNDIARGGTPEFMSTVKELIQNRAVLYNGHRLSDADVKIAAQEVLGLDITGGYISNLKDIVKTVGSAKGGMLATLERELRNIPEKAVNKLHPYIDSDFAQKYDVKYNAQDTEVPGPSMEQDDINTAIEKAAAGAQTEDLRVPGSRAPVQKDVPAAIPLAEEQQYQQEKGKERGKQGGLPLIQDAEIAKVDQASKAFEHAPADDILRLSKAYLRDKSLSEEAKHEIRLEAQSAMFEALKKEDAVEQEAIDQYTGNIRSTEGADYVDPRATVTDSSGAYTAAFKKYLDSDLVNEMRRRAGLEARPR